MEFFRLFLRNNSVYSACFLRCRPCMTESCLIFCQNPSPRASRIPRAWSSGCAMPCGSSITRCEPNEHIGIGSNARKSFAHVPRPSIDECVFYVYVLRSESDGGFYIGYSSNLRVRLWQHQDGRSRATSYRGPWSLIYYEAYLHQADALGREKYLKSGAGRRFLKAQLRHYLAEDSPRRTA
jgi:putative endonuclease